MKSLVDFIRNEFQKTPGKIDAVFLVGDIAYTGHEDEYTNFEQDFLKPLLTIESLKDTKVFAVPGNHDVECDAATPITWESIRQRNREVYFCEDDEGRKIRKPRSEVFRHYQAFIERNNIISPNSFEEVSVFYDAPNFPFDILAINTSFFCDKDEKSDEPITPCPLSALRTRLNGRERLRPLLVLGHHPQRCFLKQDQLPFESLLIDKKAVYLHGHEHDPKVISNPAGSLRSLGLGAAYVATLGEQAQAPYRNSFTRCRVDTKLHLNCYSWDSHVGRWEDATRSQFSSCIMGECFDGHSVVLNIPLLSNRLIGAVAPRAVLHSIPRKAPEPQAIFPLSLPSEKIWMRLISLSKNVNAHYRSETDPKIQSSQDVDGKSEFVTEQAEKRDLIICIPGATHVLTSNEIVSYNTRLDTEDFRSVTVLSLGKISSDARDIYSRLKAKKPIEVLVNQELTAQWRQLLSSAQMANLSNRDAGTDTVNVLVDDDAVYMLVIQRNREASFQIVDAAGIRLAPTHSVVSVLRSANPVFGKMAYDGEPLMTGEFPGLLEFDEATYLKQCYAEYNAIKYAALANVGIRFSDFSLEDVYIDASACEREAAQSNRIDDVLEDHLAAYPASEKLKAQIKQQFRNQVTGQERHETSQARAFCQKFGAVLLTGDPGSGKTCFVKSEILAYSKKALLVAAKENAPVDDWHSLHIPIMVPLSQAAAEADLEKAGLLKVASRLIERRGFYLPPDKINELLKQGRLALFFDGLDEVVSVEKRALVVQHINDVVTYAIPLGNRVVVNLLPALRQLELHGLSDSEIRTLATRILTLKLAETTEGVIIDDKELKLSDNSIIKQLLEDCAEKPGVARFASNPLLLTLLVMIYANSGAPSAKRHRIYEEAIKTLASVRGRQAGHPPVSVQDLRERLGAVALSVYRKESGFLPTLGEVTEIVRAAMSKQRGEGVPKIDAQKFIQKVAESTGLIAVGGSDGTGDEAGVVTFMHHSFMEYFAAVGLSRELDKCDVAALVTQPRWMEILTLLAGIIGESEDIAPILARFVGNGSNFGDVDAKFLIFALDCALECEVPSEAAIRLLSASIIKCVESGPARSDPWVRSEIGQRLAQLIAACGFVSFEGTIIGLIRSGAADVCGAAIALAAYACADESESTSILAALEECASRPEENILSSLCDAVGRIEWARTPALMQVVARCLKKTTRCKLAAFDAILAIPGIASRHWPEIINGLDATDIGVRRLASKAAIEAGLDGDIAALNDSRKDLVANAMRYVAESTGENEYSGSKVRDETVERLLKSGYLRDRLIGIQLIPSAQSGADSAYPKLMALLSETDDHEELTVALRTMRSSSQARVLFTVGDLKHIAKLSEAGTSDVRHASIQLLGCFGADIPAMKPLIDRDLAGISSSEYAAVFGALGRAQVLQEEIASLIEKEFLLRTHEDARMNAEYLAKICALLDSARCLGRNLRPQVTSAIRNLIDDYRQDDRVKGMALRAYAATVIPSGHVVEFLTKLFDSPPYKLVSDLAKSLGAFAKNCRQSVEYVMACVEPMSNLRVAAISLHKRISKREVTGENEFMTTELRDGIHEISEIIVTFEDFINGAHSNLT
jgi:calcineurin-like phosphoesterase family protein